MGLCESCLRGTSSKRGYTPIQSTEIPHRTTSTGQSAPVIDDEVSFHNVMDSTEAAKLQQSFNPDSFVFKGVEVQQKFSHRGNFENKFIWISQGTFTIHMSQFVTKEKKHKEANLSDITTIVCGAPNQKGQNKAELPPRELERLNSLCLTVNFQKGGGIDLKFQTQAQRDEWHSIVTKLVAGQKVSKS